MRLKFRISIVRHLHVHRLGSRGAALVLARLGLWFRRDVALQRVVMVAVVFAGVGEVPGVAGMAEVAVLLGAAGVLRFGGAGGGAEEECAAEDRSKSDDFDDPAHG